MPPIDIGHAKPQSIRTFGTFNDDFLAFKDPGFQDRAGRERSALP